MLQQEDDYNCGVYAIMKAMSLNFGTNALAHDLVKSTRFMIMYATLGDLYWKEADEDGNYELRTHYRVFCNVLILVKTDLTSDELYACVRLSAFAIRRACFKFIKLSFCSTSIFFLANLLCAHPCV